MYSHTEYVIPCYLSIKNVCGIFLLYCWIESFSWRHMFIYVALQKVSPLTSCKVASIPKSVSYLQFNKIWSFFFTLIFLLLHIENMDLCFKFWQQKLWFLACSGMRFVIISGNFHLYDGSWLDLPVKWLDVLSPVTTQ